MTQQTRLRRIPGLSRWNIASTKIRNSVRSAEFRCFVQQCFRIKRFVRRKSSGELMRVVVGILFPIETIRKIHSEFQTKLFLFELYLTCIPFADKPLYVHSPRAARNLRDFWVMSQLFLTVDLLPIINSMSRHCMLVIRRGWFLFGIERNFLHQNHWWRKGDSSSYMGRKLLRYHKLYGRKRERTKDDSTDVWRI